MDAVDAARLAQDDPGAHRFSIGGSDLPAEGKEPLRDPEDQNVPDLLPLPRQQGHVRQRQLLARDLERGAVASPLVGVALLGPASQRGDVASIGTVQKGDEHHPVALEDPAVLAHHAPAGELLAERLSIGPGYRG